MTHSTDHTVTDRRWLATILPFVREHLPAAPARVLEIGCGPSGGFVPDLVAAGYDAVGVDPVAPEGPAFCQAEFEQYDVRTPVDAIVACTSLHHVTDLDDVADRLRAALTSDGALVVVEWASEMFDEETAQWCFARLPDDEHGWLHERHDAWVESGLAWADHMRERAHEHRLHTGQDMSRALASRFTAEVGERTPYFFCSLTATYDEEAGAIAAGRIQATGIRFVGRPKPSSDALP